jgi:copper(I)-binding protein
VAELAVVQAAEAWCRPTPNGVSVGGCYVALTASRNDRLVSVVSPVSPDAQIHTMSMEDGMMRMAQLTDGLALPAGETVTLRPGAEHLMLMALTQPLVEGETVSLTLNFDGAPDVTVDAVVRQPTILVEHSGDHSSH